MSLNTSKKKADQLEEKQQIFVYSFNHKKIELSVREKLKLDSSRISIFKDKINQLSCVREFVLLDTCNRWELYIVFDEGSQEVIWNEIVGVFPLSSHKLTDIVSIFQESVAIQHLFEVSSGVDSQMVGETEIFGQVKNAFFQGKKDHTVGFYLDKVFSKAFQSAKWVRTHTSISRGTISIGNVSVDLAMRIFGDLRERKVLLVGSGEVGRLTAQSLKSRNVKSISFTSRTLDNAQKLCDEIGGEFFEYTELHHRLHEYDIVITSTSAPHFILELKASKKVMRKRSYRPLFVIDLAMPRDVDPSVGKISQLFLYNLDDVSKIANENLDSRSQEIMSCKQVLSGKAWSVWLDMRRRYHLRSFHERRDNASEKLPVTKC